MFDLIPELSLAQCEVLYSLGETLVYDDRHDIGFFTYSNRKNHYYNGRKAPHHKSPMHHWQLGGLLILLSQVAGLAAVAREAQEPSEQESYLTYDSNTIT